MSTIGLLWIAAVVAFVAAAWRLTGPAKPYERRVHGPGAGAAGAMYELLNKDQRNAIEVIVEERTGERDAEHADDTPPRA